VNDAAAPKFSIIIPSYNEELRLPATLDKIATYVRQSERSTEVIVVDDGSRDRTAEVAATFQSQLPRLRVVSNGVNRGKGFSVRHGMLEARGEFVIFTDADLSSPIEEADKLLVGLVSGFDVAIGSRALDRSLIEVHEIGVSGICWNRVQPDRPDHFALAVCRHPVRFQGIPARTLPHSVRATED
jgi:glycosyltransferase involved in cell wall biosynthesis